MRAMERATPNAAEVEGLAFFLLSFFFRENRRPTETTAKPARILWVGGLL
jgi:hypothetical protein